MKDDTTISPLHQPGMILDPLTVARAAALAISRKWPAIRVSAGST